MSKEMAMDAIIVTDTTRSYFAMAFKRLLAENNPCCADIQEKLKVILKQVAIHYDYCRFVQDVQQLAMPLAEGALSLGLCVLAQSTDQEAVVAVLKSNSLIDIFRATYSLVLKCHNMMSEHAGFESGNHNIENYDFTVDEEFRNYAGSGQDGYTRLLNEIKAREEYAKLVNIAIWCICELDGPERVSRIKGADQIDNPQMIVNAQMTIIYYLIYMVVGGQKTCQTPYKMELNSKIERWKQKANKLDEIYQSIRQKFARRFLDDLALIDSLWNHLCEAMDQCQSADDLGEYLMGPSVEIYCPELDDADS